MIVSINTAIVLVWIVCLTVTIHRHLEMARAISLNDPEQIGPIPVQVETLCLLGTLMGSGWVGMMGIDAFKELFA